MRLIDADALKQAYCDECPEKDCADCICLQIDEAATVDAEPVKHSRWTLTTDEDTGAEVLWCGNCKIGFVDGPERFGRPPYCPRCGAKMDGKR